MHSLCILYAADWLLFVIILYLFFIYSFIYLLGHILCSYFFLNGCIYICINLYNSLCTLYASAGPSSLCIRHASTIVHPNVHQRFSVRFMFFFVPYSFSLLYPIHTHEKLGSTERPILGRYRPISAVLVVRPIFFRVRIRSLSVLILFSSIHYSYIYARA